MITIQEFGEIETKLDKYFTGKIGKNEMKKELANMIIIANRLDIIPNELMNYIRELDKISTPYHWGEKI